MKDRETVCKYYICKDECAKGRTAEFRGYCQRCDKYEPRAKERHINKKKQKRYEDKEYERNDSRN